MPLNQGSMMKTADSAKRWSDSGASSSVPKLVITSPATCTASAAALITKKGFRYSRLRPKRLNSHASRAAQTGSSSSECVTPR